MAPDRRSILRRLFMTTFAASASASVTACTTMKVNPEPVPAPLSASSEREVVLRLRNDAEVHLYHAHVEGDMIIGFTDTKSSPESRMAVDSRDVRFVSVRTLQKGRTVVAVVAGAYATLLIVALAACAAAA